jgi:hypothetical protein
MTTVGDLLNRSRSDPIVAAAAHLSHVTARMERGQAAVNATTLASLRAIDVSDVLAAGWHHCPTLREVGRATLARRGNVIRVPIRTLTVTATYDATLEVIDGRQPVGEVPFVFVVTVEMAKFEGTVVNGQLVDFMLGTMVVHLTLVAAGRTFTSDEIGLRPEAELWIGAGVPLVPGA